MHKQHMTKQEQLDLHAVKRLLGRKPGLTIAQMAKELDLTPTVVKGYVLRLCRAKKIESVVEHHKPNIYFVRPDRDKPRPVERDWMVAAFFGPPASASQSANV